jgi:hypothetical protein
MNESKIERVLIKMDSRFTSIEQDIAEIKSKLDNQFVTKEGLALIEEKARNLSEKVSKMEDNQTKIVVAIITSFIALILNWLVK